MKTKSGKPRLAPPIDPETGRVCVRCRRNGHAALIWHWQRGSYCVLCIREMMGIVSDFLAREEAFPAAVATPGMFEKGRKA